MKNLIVYSADIGSIKANNFGWARFEVETEGFATGTSICDFVDRITEDIRSGFKTAIGFECPLFLELPDNPINLTSARQGEGSRAWSAGAGAGALATGLTEVLWIFNRVSQSIRDRSKIMPTYSMDELLHGDANFLVWEAFVSNKDKNTEQSHDGDALKAAREFAIRLRSDRLVSDVSVNSPYSLVGAALLRSGITDDLSVLCEQCLVIKA